jgi:presenilin-like A22 family membrane protease
MREITSVILMFILVQALGLYVAGVMINNSTNPEFSGMDVTPTKDPGSFLNVIYFVIVVLVGALFLLVLIKYYKGVFAYKLLESFIIFFASYIVFNAILYSFSGPLSKIWAPLGEPDLWAILGGLCLAGLKYAKPNTKNIAAIISSAGVGALFGFSVDLLPAVLFIIFLSIYDFYAVFKTKHMVTMARELGKRNMSFSVSVESMKKRKPTPAELKQMKAAEKKLEAAGEAPKPLKEFIEERTHLELGTGDMAIPLMLAVSAFKFGGLNHGMYYALAATIGACAGLYFVLDYVLSRKSFLPALPPISAGALLGIGLVWLAGF